MEELIKQIPTLGFPTVLCLLMAWGVWKVLNKVVDRFLKSLDDITETNKELSKTNQDLIKSMDFKIDRLQDDIERFINKN